MRFSQNQTQLDAGEMSYTKYDHLSRVVEVGDSTLPGDVSAAVDDQSRPTNGQHRVLTLYTTPADSTVTGLTHNGRYVDWTPQRYTLNRIAHVFTDDGVHTQYSYDPHGNVEWVRQEIPELGTNYVRYEYDLISGNMLRMLYDEGWEDQYIQRYRYDEDNRLREVESSRDGEIYESDARYTYYAHGPLRRVEYGEDSVQGIDYTYTLQGWLKAINHPSLDTSAGGDVDPGSDGFGTRRWFAPDAFGMMLGYYDGDFVHGSSRFASGSSVPASSYHLMPSYDLYNGNIATWTTNIQPAGTGGPIDEQLVGYTYRYDVLNRLLEANYHTYGSGGTWTGSLSEYTSSYTYDPNGNILTLDRGGDTTGAGAMDKLTYAYYGGTNQLRQVSDLVSATKYSEDIDDQSDTSNYTYDAIGNMIGDVSENITNIEWSIYGKVLSVTKANQVLEFTYDAAGNRVRKQVYDPNDPSSLRSTYYVYEAGGKVVAIYENCVDPEPSPHEGVDTDNDGIPDTCDPDPMNPSIPPPGGDIDGDGVSDAVDPCPCTAGPAGDQDDDGIPDGTDPNPCAPNCTEAFHLAEWVIYGNGAQGRIAETKPTDLARPAGEGTAIDTTNEYHVRVLSEKYYELKDHLGNVRVVVTDMKEPTVQSGTYPCVAVVSSYANYYAYGMLQPGRSWEGGEWRYGFNGQERESEQTTKEAYSAQYWYYVPAVCQRWNIDPKARSSDSPYACYFGNPIIYIDPNGLEPVVEATNNPDDANRWKWRIEKGDTYTSIARRVNELGISDANIDNLRGWNGIPDRALPVGAIIEVVDPSTAGQHERPTLLLPGNGGTVTVDKYTRAHGVEYGPALALTLSDNESYATQPDNVHFFQTFDRVTEQGYKVDDINDEGRDIFFDLNHNLDPNRLSMEDEPGKSGHWIGTTSVVQRIDDQWVPLITFQWGWVASDDGRIERTLELSIPTHPDDVHMCVIRNFLSKWTTSGVPPIWSSDNQDGNHNPQCP